MERLLFDTACLREIGEIRYYVLTDRIPQDGEFCGVSQIPQSGETCGVSQHPQSGETCGVRTREACGVMVELGEERTEIADITPSRRRVRSLLDRMCRGTVTPVAVRDVVDDWLLE